MTWHTSRDVHAFLAAAGDFLENQPVDHTVLLTEAAYLVARPSDATDQWYGWWQAADRGVDGAFLKAPRHPPILSNLPAEAVECLVDMSPDLPPIGVDGRLVEPVITAWRRAGVELAERSRARLYRLDQLETPTMPPGRARVATDDDRVLLLDWYRQLMVKYPDDPSDQAYVVDDPLSAGGIVLWEVDRTPRAMVGRSRMVAGMVRLSAVYAPDGDLDCSTAAFVAACICATELARDVLVFAGATDTATDAAYRRLGFRPVLDRVLLGPATAD